MRRDCVTQIIVDWGNGEWENFATPFEAEQYINAMLDEEADQLVGAGPYERTDERAADRAGHYERGFTTTSGQVTLKMPKLKGMRFATAVIERYKRRETSVEEAIIEMRPAGVSTRRIEDVK